MSDSTPRRLWASPPQAKVRRATIAMVVLGVVATIMGCTGSEDSASTPESDVTTPASRFDTPLDEIEEFETAQGLGVLHVDEQGCLTLGDAGSEVLVLVSSDTVIVDGILRFADGAEFPLGESVELGGGYRNVDQADLNDASRGCADDLGVQEVFITAG